MTPLTDTLCLQCGLCCNGVLFADVRAERGEDSPLFDGRKRVSQPCPAFQNETGACTIYPQRPARCRKFECRQLLEVQAEHCTAAAALNRIRAARKLVAGVGGLLAQLSDDDPELPLCRRFQRCQRAAEKGQFNRDQLDTLAELQLRMHELNVRLARDFYAPHR